MNVVILAREGSTRYPGKHLHPIGGKPMLAGIIEQIIKHGGRPILCTGKHENNKRIVQVAIDSGADFYCQEETPEWDIVSRMVSMAFDLGIGKWISVSGDCPFSDFTLLKPLWERVVEGDADTVSGQTPYSTVIGDRSISAATAVWYMKMHDYFPIDDQRREQPWVHYPDTKSVVIGNADRTATPIKTSIDWPLEGAIADLVVRHLGHWPESDAEIQWVYSEISKVTPAVGGVENTVEEDA